MSHAFTPAINHHDRSGPSEAVSELMLDSLCCHDCVIVTTANATYCFIVSDPARKRGLLSGGVLGGMPVTAVLLGAEIRKSGEVSALFSKLCVGSRAIFFIASSDNVHQMVTSTITRIVHTRLVVTASGGHSSH